MSCCGGSNSRNKSTSTNKKATHTQVPAPVNNRTSSSAMAMKISNQAVAQIAQQMAKKHPYLLQNQMM